MYRLLESIPASPVNSRIRQEPTAKEADPQKGRPAGKTCRRRGGNNHRPQPFGRPVTSAGQRNATPVGVAFRSFGAELFCRSNGNAGAVTGNRHLPAGTLLCSIRLAYQAADASHPKRAERARRRARKLRRNVYSLIQEHAAETPIGRALPEESTCRSESLQKPLGNGNGDSASSEAKQQWGHSSGDRGRLR